jgi:penicillin amidase
MSRFLLKALASILALVVIALGLVSLYLRRSLPLVDGATTVAGLSAPIDIIRDADAIPHIFATNKADALFGLGYVHAQDRLWQMEWQRRIGYGRLSELLGETTVPQDRFLRTVGFGRAARAAWASTPGWAKDQINAYVAGVNAFVSTHHGSALPPEFSLLRFEPEPWTGADVIVWVKMMAWDLSANWSFELLRHDLVLAVGAERMAQLMPPYPIDGLSILPKTTTTEDTDTNGGHGSQQEDLPVSSVARDREAVADTRVPPSQGFGEARQSAKRDGGGPYAPAFVAALSQGDPSVRDFLLRGATTEGLGSNNWVVDGTRTASGKPLLANDPHLSAQVPSTWYLAHVSGGDFEIIGATLPGAPAVALGRNRFIAWGATNVAADVEDLYREKLDATGTLAAFRGAQEPVTVIPETIVVKGREPVRIDVRVTRHGPLISDAINATSAELKRDPRPPPLEPLAFRWTALDADDATVPSFLKLNEARNWGQFTDALRDFVTPSQNFVYADVDGHIGYYAPGRIPMRASGDGSLPAEGWTGAAEWTGWIPFDELPHTYDPPAHFIVTANNRPAPPDYRHLLGLEWPEPYRAQRIVDLLGGKTGLTPDDFARMQADTLSLHAKALLPLLLARAHPGHAPDEQAMDLLRQWNGEATADSAAAAIFGAWFHQLAPAIVGDDLGPLLTDRYQERFSFVTRFVINTLAPHGVGADSPWCDDVTTAGKHETCDEAVTEALHRAVVDLTQRMGGDVARWRWDSVHHAIFPHPLGAVAALRPFLNRSVPNGGDWSTVDVGAAAADHPYEQHAVPGYREIIDLSPANDSRFIDAVGESGHPLSRHYDDFLADWRAVRHRKMRMERADIERGALGHLHLSP